MRLLILLLVLVGWALISIAAQTYKVPITIVPGSINLIPPGGPTSPATLPLSQFGSSSGCSGTFSAEIVDGGLEVELNGAASNCELNFSLGFNARLVAPELGGTATMVRLEVTPLQSNFSALEYARVTYNPQGDGLTSSSPNRPFYCRHLRADYELSPNLNPNVPESLVLTPLIPGDTVTCPGVIDFRFRSGVGSITSGRLRVRYEFLVTVPEPSASLSLPLGTAWLASISMMRRGA